VSMGVLVTTYNEERNLERCLRSVAWADHVYVVDSFSTDGTLEIAERWAQRVDRHEYVSAARQKNWALERMEQEWILILDADEEVTPELREEILEELRAPRHEGYWIRRRNHYLGRPIRHAGWSRDRVLRLLRRDAGRYDDRMVHEEITLRSRPGTLRHPLVHHPYADLASHLEKIQRYSDRGALDLVREGARLPLLKTFLHPPARFLRMYVLQAGFLDGIEGFVLCLLSSYAVFYKYAKTWEILERERRD
jgi:glycosyltransferase involved in cell wall biosynthesis